MPPLIATVEGRERLYVSVRTAEYHLSKVFTKLNVTSRIQLEGALT